ncbi:MAG: hypothetical protein QG675_76 [Patescibacteria group bacterium]|jgi:type IV secretory pathway VirB2 component (pilin)|nr:hypothetical protein [Patescibacteria group bacterium]
MRSILYIAGLTAPPGLGGPADFGSLISTITNLLLGIAGSIAVIFIIVGGIQYATSAGDDGKVQSAKNTIFNAVIGLVITVMAFAIVNFLLNIFK